jgi:hypothetical protein
VAVEVKDFYDRYPYPPPVDDLDAYRRRWQQSQRKIGAMLASDVERDTARSLFERLWWYDQVVFYATERP